MNIAINGLGRMGSLFVRAVFGEGHRLVAINEPAGTPQTLALAIAFDSTHGRFAHEVQADGEDLRLGDQRVRLLQNRDVRDLPWRELQVDLVVDCSGRSKQREPFAEHLAQGAQAVLVANPVKAAPNVVYGVNHHDVDFGEQPIVSAASCTTNCLAPIVRVLHDAIGIERGAITTIHAPTNTQGVHDRAHDDARRSRSALSNLIPTTTNSATAVTLIVPELAGRLDSIAVRTPVMNASLTDCVFHMQRDTTVDEVNAALRVASEQQLRGVLGYEARPLVSSDFVTDPRSGIVDADCTRVIDDRMVKVMAWYDNEWGYVQRMLDLTRLCASQIR